MFLYQLRRLTNYFILSEIFPRSSGIPEEISLKLSSVWLLYAEFDRVNRILRYCLFSADRSSNVNLFSLYDSFNNLLNLLRSVDFLIFFLITKNRL